MQPDDAPFALDADPSPAGTHLLTLVRYANLSLSLLRGAKASMPFLLRACGELKSAGCRFARRSRPAGAATGMSPLYATDGRTRGRRPSSAA